MAGAPWLSSAPTASATRSAPSCDGSSMPMFRPVLTPAPTMSTRQPVTSSTASRSTAVTGGATLASTAPSNRAGSIPRSERLRSMRTAYSSAVRVARVSSERGADHIAALKAAYSDFHAAGVQGEQHQITPLRRAEIIRFITGERTRFIPSSIRKLIPARPKKI